MQSWALPCDQDHEVYKIYMTKHFFYLQVADKH